MAKFQLTIVTPRGLIYDREVEALTAAGECGRFGILPHHAAMLASLQPGFMKVSEPEERYFAIGAGILEVGPGGTVNVLADSAEPAATREAAVSRAAELTA